MIIKQVQKLNQPELKQIIILHRKELNTSFLNNFGDSFLKILYSATVQSHNNMLLLLLDKDKVAGYAVATKDVSSFYSEVINKLSS